MHLILFVCTGNTCRSPMAEVLFRREWIKLGCTNKVKVASAGLAALPGEKASANARELMHCEGVDLESHITAALDRETVDSASLILAMTGAQREMITERFPLAAAKTFLLKEFAGAVTEGPDVEDPYGGNMDKYRSVMEEISSAVTKIILRLKKEGWPDESGSWQ